MTESSKDTPKGQQPSRGLWIGAIAASAAVLGVGAWLMWGSGAARPATSPSVTPTHGASPTSEPPDLTFPAPLPADGFFLAAQQLTSDVWSTVSDGWTLTYWQPSRQAYGDAGVDVTDPGVSAVYLMSPQGERYEVGHFDAPDGESVNQIAWWEPGAFEAIVATWADDAVAWQWLDLTDGRLTPVGGISPDAGFVGWAADGKLLFEDGGTIVAIAHDASNVTLVEDGGGAQLSPDGTVIATFQVDDSGGPQPVTAYSASTGEVLWSFDAQSLATGDEYCTPGGWAVPNEPAVVCQSWGGTDADYTVGPASFYSLSAAGATNVLTTDDTFAWSSPQIAADGVVATGADPNAQGIGQLYYLTGDASVPLVTPVGHGYFPTLQTLGTVDITRWSSMADYTSVTARDVATGAAFEVTPPQQADPQWWWTTRQAVFLVGGIGGAS